MSDAPVSTATHKGIRTITVQRPEKLNALNRQTLEALDAAFAEMGRTGAPVQSALARVLQERGLVTLDAELGEPFERVSAPVRDGAASERRLPPQQGWTAPERGVGR